MVKGALMAYLLRSAILELQLRLSLSMMQWAIDTLFWLGRKLMIYLKYIALQLQYKIILTAKQKIR